MTKIIQTKVDTNGDVHLEFSGFLGRDCEIEDARLRRELAALGLNIDENISQKTKEGHADSPQQSISLRANLQ